MKDFYAHYPNSSENIADLVASDRHGDTALHQAASNGLLGRVRDLAEAYEQHRLIDTTNHAGMTPLHHASANGHLSIVQNLLRCGATPTLCSRNGKTALHYAAMNGRSDVIQALIKAGANHSARDNTGAIALHAAAEGGHFSTVQCLVEQGINPCTYDQRRFTALHCAAAEGYLDIVQYLIDNGANPYARDKTGMTALQHAAMGGHVDVLRFLIGQYGLKPEYQHDHISLAVTSSDRRVSPNRRQACLTFFEEEAGQLYQGYLARLSGLSEEQTSEWLAAIKQGPQTVHNYLLKQYGEWCVEGSGHIDAKSAAFTAAQKGLLHVLWYFTKMRGATIVARDAQDRTVLHHAVQHGRAVMVDYYLKTAHDVKADLRRADQNGMAVLHHAAAKGHLSIVQCLIDYGAHLHVGDHQGMTALHHAIFQGHPQIARALLATEADPCVPDHAGMTALHHAARMGDLDTLDSIFKAYEARGIFLTTSDMKGRTALHYAAASGHLQVVQRLIEKGIDPHVRDHNGMTALHCAAQRGKLDVLKYLYPGDLKQNSLHKDARGRTLLHHAALGGQVETIQYLIEVCEADPNEPDFLRGCTATHCAAAGGHLAALAYLSECGANLQACDLQGNSALHYALHGEHTEAIVSLIEQHGLDHKASNHKGERIIDKAKSTNKAKKRTACTTFCESEQKLQALHERYLKHKKQFDPLRAKLAHLSGVLSPLSTLLFSPTKTQVTATDKSASQRATQFLETLPDTFSMIELQQKLAACLLSVKKADVPQNSEAQAVETSSVDGGEQSGSAILQKESATAEEEKWIAALQGVYLSLEKKLHRATEAFDRGAFAYLHTLLSKDRRILQCVLSASTDKTLGQHMGKNGEQLSAFISYLDAVFHKKCAAAVSSDEPRQQFAELVRDLINASGLRGKDHERLMQQRAESKTTKYRSSLESFAATVTGFFSKSKPKLTAPKHAYKDVELGISVCSNRIAVKR